MAADLNKVISVSIKVLSDNKGQLQAAVTGFQKLAKVLEGVDTAAKAAKSSVNGLNTALSKTAGVLKSWESAAGSVSATGKDLHSVAKNADSVSKSFTDMGRKEKVLPKTRSDAKKLSTAMSIVNKRLTSTNLTLSKMGYALGVASAGLSQISSKMSGVTRGLSAIRAGIAMITGFSTTFLALFALKGTIKQLAEFDDSLRAAGAAAGASQDELEQMEITIRELGATTRFTSKEVATVAKQLSLAGFTIPETLKALPGVLQLAAAGMMDVGDAADIATNVLRGYGMQVEDLAHVNDVLVAGFTNSNTTLIELGHAFTYVGPIAHAAGMAFEETAALLAALAQSGYKSTKAGVVLRNGIVRLLAPTRKAAKVIADLGIATKKSDGSMRSMIAIIDDLIKSGATVTDLVTIFGRRAGPGMAALISRGTASLEHFNKLMIESGGTARAVATYMESGFGGSMRRLKSIWEELTITFGRMLEVDLTDYFERLTVSLRKNRTQIAAFGKAVVDILEGLLDFGIWVVKTAHDFPTLTKAIIGFGLALPALVKFVGIMGELKALGMAQSFKELMALKYGPMLVGLKSISAGLVVLKGAFVDLFAAMVANPLGAFILAAGAVTAAIMLWKKNLDELVDSHLRLAQTYKAMQDEYAGQISELEKLDEVFRSAEKGSSEWYDAERKLADLVPGVRTEVDEYGNVLAKVGDYYDSNRAKLALYIQDLKDAKFDLFAAQLGELSTALKNAGREYKSSLNQFKAVGILEKYLGPVMKLFGDYKDRLNSSVSGSQKAFARATKALDKYVFEAVKQGKTIEDVRMALDLSGVEIPEIRQAVIKSYYKYADVVKLGIKNLDKLKADTIAAYNADQKLAEARFQATKQFTASQKAEMKKYLRDVAILEAKGVLSHKEAETKKMEITLQLQRDMLDRTARSYKEMSDQNMDLSEISKVLDKSMQAFSQSQLNYLSQALTEKRNVMEQAAREEEKIAEESKNHALKISELKSKAYEREAQAKVSTNQKIAELERSLATKIEDIVAKRNSRIRKLEQERISLEKAAAADIEGVNDTLQDKLRAIAQRGMSDSQKELDNKQAAERKLYKGQQLINKAKQEGDKAALARGKAMIQQAGSLFESLKSVQAAYDGLKRAAEAEKQAIKAGLDIALAEVDAKERKAQEEAKKEIDKANKLASHRKKLYEQELVTQIQNTEKKLAADLKAENLRHATVMANLSKEALKYQKDLNEAKDRINKILQYTPTESVPELAAPVSKDSVDLAIEARKNAAQYAAELNKAEKEWLALGKHVEDLKKLHIEATKVKGTLQDAAKSSKLMSPEDVSQAMAELDRVDKKVQTLKTSTDTMLGEGLRGVSQEAAAVSSALSKSDTETANTARTVQNMKGEWVQVHDTVRKIDGVWTNMWADSDTQLSKTEAKVSNIKEEFAGISSSFGVDIEQALIGTSDIKQEIVKIDGVWTQVFTNVAAKTKAVTGQLVSGMQSAVDKYGEIKDKHVKVYVDFVQKKAIGGLVQSFATGGRVAAAQFRRLSHPFINRGSGTKDDVPAMLKRNEFVMRPEAVKHYGLGLLYALNNRSVQRNLLPHFSMGGLVTALQNGVRASIPHLASGGLAAPSPGFGPLANLGTVTIGVNNSGFPVIGDVKVINSLKQALVKEGLMRGQ